MRSNLPTWLDFTLLSITWGAILWRFYASNSVGSPRRVTESLAAGAVALTLKVGPIYDLVVPLTGPAVLRALIHGACLVAVAGVISLWYTAQGEMNHPQIVPSLYAISGGLSAGLIATATFAPRSGEQMESAPDLWAVGYFAIFCVPTVLGLALLVKHLISSWRQSRSRLISTTVTATYTLLVVDNVTVFIAVISSVVRDDRGWLDGRAAPNGFSFAILLTVGAVISAVAARNGAARTVRDPMTAMWLDLRRYCPEVTLSEPWSLRGREQRLRAVVESVDALAQLAPLVRDSHIDAARKLTEGPPSLVLAVALQEAATTNPGAASQPEGGAVLAANAVAEVGTLSMQWQRAKDLRGAARDRSQ